MDSPHLKGVLLQSIVRPLLPGDDYDTTASIPKQELVQFLTDTHNHFDSQGVLKQGVYGLVIQWLGNFERDGSPTMLGAEEFAIIRFSDKIFLSMKSNLPASSLFRTYVDALSLVYCKLALLDFSYYTKSTHPARQYMNGLYKATVGLNEAEIGYAQPILSKIDSIIKTMLEHSGEGSDVFLILLANLKTFLSEYEMRVAVVEKRLRDTEIGKYNSQRAHTYVVENVNRYLKGASLPKVIDEFVKGDWVASLQLALLKDGSKSANWKKMLKLTETLIWCFGSRSTVEMKSLYNFLMTLLNGIRNSLYAINHDEERLTATVASIEAELIRVMKGESLELRQCSPIEVGIAIVDDGMSEVPIDSLRFVNELAVGDWLMLKKEEDQVQFAKLAVIISGKGCYIFVNRFGMRLLEINKHDLAIEHNDKKIFNVEKGMVFDRAISESVRHFKKIQAFKGNEQRKLERKARESVSRSSVVEPEVTTNKGKATEPPLLTESTSSEFTLSESTLSKPKLLKPKLSESLVSNDKPNIATPSRARLQETADEQVLKARSRSQERAERKYDIDDAVLTQLPGGMDVNSNADNEDDVDQAHVKKIKLDGHSAGEGDENTLLDEPESVAANIEKQRESQDNRFDPEQLAPFLKEVDSINIGGWIEFSENDDAPIKCKLAVKIKVTQRMIFVDRMGVKALDINEQDLAQRLASDQAIILDRGKVFDATLEAVVKSIRKEKSDKRL